ncbi:MAG: A/G-specific adenine glycosylase [Alphaproteobacteria bacterium]|nr:A/G-specific adenine glycosylase [Alphaproteobacteria bacterium]
MPWRAAPGEKPDPYRVWLSEIMLQQTTVATVGPYFRQFVERWPTLDDLAAASLDDILRLWAGLGYYRRARLLHQCAAVVHADYGGVFPRDEDALRALPGFGPYTAAAVAAIAFDKPANVVDGNVERVMARIFAIKTPLPAAKAELRAAAATLVPQKRCGDYAQALMDLGATVCTPRAPKCGICPWRDACQAHAQGIAETLPRRTKKAARPTRRAVAFVLCNEQGDILLRRRPSHGLLADMMEIPSSPWGETPLPALDDVAVYAPAKAKWRAIPGLVTHVFTHFTLEIAVASAVIGASAARKTAGQWVRPDKIQDEALPSVMKKIVRHALAKL